MKFFLDIDGVMVHADPSRRVDMEEDGFYKFDTVAVNSLNSVLSYESDFEVIISSSHRHRFSINEWKEIFYRRNIFIENLSILDIPFPSYKSRKEEIWDWISQKHLSPDEFIIIDDDKSLNGLPHYIKDRLLLTNPYRGLNDELVNKFAELSNALKKLQTIHSVVNSHSISLISESIYKVDRINKMYSDIAKYSLPLLVDSIDSVKRTKEICFLSAEIVERYSVRDIKNLSSTTVHFDKSDKESCKNYSKYDPWLCKDDKKKNKKKDKKR